MIFTHISVILITLCVIIDSLLILYIRREKDPLMRLKCYGALIGCSMFLPIYFIAGKSQITVNFSIATHLFLLIYSVMSASTLSIYTKKLSKYYKKMTYVPYIISALFALGNIAFSCMNFYRQ